MTKALQFITPRGTIKFPSTKIGETEYKVIKPYHPKEGEDVTWKFVLSFDPKSDQAQDLLTALSEEHAKIKGANFQPFKKDKSRNENDEIVENGNIAINFTSGYPVRMVDSSLKECSVELGWGAEVIVKFNVKPVNNLGKVGLGRYPALIQVLSIGGDSDTTGLQPQEGYNGSKETSSEEKVEFTE